MPLPTPLSPKTTTSMTLYVSVPKGGDYIPAGWEYTFTKPSYTGSYDQPFNNKVLAPACPRWP